MLFSQIECNVVFMFAVSRVFCSDFRAVRDAVQCGLQCATHAPVANFAARSHYQCSGECAQHVDCTSFNYRKNSVDGKRGSVCELFDCATYAFDVELDCAHYKKIQAPICPCGFTYYPAVNICYKLVLENLPWDQIGPRCASIYPKSTAVVINSSAEQTVVKSLLNGSPMTGCYMNYGKIIWTAGQRIIPTQNTAFVWKTTNVTSPLVYTNFNPGQPDFYGGVDACIGVLEYYGFRWNDDQCQKGMCTICQADRIL